MPTVIGRTRTCSCCGQPYTEWKEQDIEGNNCQRCTFWILRDEVRDKRRSIELLCSKMQPENQQKLLAMTFRQQRHIVNEAWKEGILTYSIR